MSTLRRFKPYPAYRASGVEWLGEIPANWVVCRLKEIVTGIEQGWSPLCENRQADDNEWGVLKVGCVNGESFNQAEHKALPGELRPIPAYEIRAGDILMSRANTRNLLGSAALVHSVRTRLLLCDKLYRIRVSRKRVLPEFVVRAVASRPARFQLERGATGASASMQNISQGTITNLLLPLPSTAEQRGIAAFLDRETARIDALVAKKGRLIELLQEKRAALITRAVTKGLGPTVGAPQRGSEIFSRIPAGYGLQKLRRLISQVKRPVTVDLDAEYQEIGIRSWGRGIFHKEPLRGALFEDKDIFRIEPGDFVLNIVFAWEGAVAVVSEQERGMVGSHRFPTFRASHDVDLDYLLMVLQTEQGRWLMEVNSPGAAGRNKTIRLDQFLDEAIPIPPLPVQLEIVQAYRNDEQRLDALVRRLREGVAALEELRTAIITAAVTGKIDVRGAVA